MFVGRLSAKQVLALYHASGEDFDASMECLLEGPTLSSIVCMLNAMFSKRSVTKLEVDTEDVWQDNYGCTLQVSQDQSYKEIANWAT